MGESKRRKMLDPSYGKHSQKPSSFISELEKAWHNSADELYLEHKQSVLNSDRLSDSQFNFLNEQEELTEKERNQLKRAKIERTYGIKVTDELITKDDDGWYPKIRLHYFLTVGNEFLANYDNKQVNDILEYSDREIFLPDFNQKLLLAEIDTLKLLNIEQFLDKDQKFTEYDFYLWFEDLKRQNLILDGSDDDFCNNRKKWLEKLKKLPRLLPIVALGTTEIGFAEKILDKLGLTLIRQGLGYRCHLLDDGRKEVFDYWLEKDQKFLKDLSKKVRKHSFYS